MNARVALFGNEGPIEITPDEVKLAVRSLLASPIFAKAPRMCDLLSFLVDKKISGDEGEISEYAIGVKVFRRDAQVYDTFLDPVVRVQVGRLRNRLAAYYSKVGVKPAVQIAIPPGSYVPVIEPLAATPPRVRWRQLELVPLRDLTAEHVRSGFVAGVDEELGNRLFQAFGRRMHMHSDRSSGRGVIDVPADAAYRLEGSIRVEKNHVRASVRLIDIRAGQVEWLSQFDCSGELGIRLQEELAGTICERLQFYLAN